MNRTETRKLCFFLMFQLEFCEKCHYEECKEIFFQENNADANKEYIENKVDAILNSLGEIDSYISKYSKDWSIDRLSGIDRSILRLSIYEILFEADVPTVVSINEAVELAEAFGEEESYSFVNGILGAVARNLVGDN